MIADELVTVVKADEPLDAPGPMTNDGGGIVVCQTLPADPRGLLVLALYRVACL